MSKTAPSTETPPATSAAPANLKLVSTEAAEAAFIEAVASTTAPVVQRLASHRNRIDLVVKELESERFELLSRRDQLRRQAEAVDQGLTMHLDDIDATLALYAQGMNSLNAGGAL